VSEALKGGAKLMSGFAYQRVVADLDELEALRLREPARLARVVVALGITRLVGRVGRVAQPLPGGRLLGAAEHGVEVVVELVRGVHGAVGVHVDPGGVGVVRRVVDGVGEAVGIAVDRGELSQQRDLALVAGGDEADDAVTVGIDRAEVARHHADVGERSEQPVPGGGAHVQQHHTIVERGSRLRAGLQPDGEISPTPRRGGRRRSCRPGRTPPPFTKWTSPVVRPTTRSVAPSPS